MRMCFAQEENLAARKVEIEPKKKSAKAGGDALRIMRAFVRTRERFVCSAAERKWRKKPDFAR